ncbi:unnamed protein product [Nesidiocoris tenuis]|uniref:Uncharacterized protein n=1 Tax=Nesidiocoris tenuis TaxID=355587 RepID=A0A6H5HB57_9HEMI|nr:unnamed protein product [Nesidiocoris tenuis]
MRKSPATLTLLERAPIGGAGSKKSATYQVKVEFSVETSSRIFGVETDGRKVSHVLSVAEEMRRCRQSQNRLARFSADVARQIVNPGTVVHADDQMVRTDGQKRRLDLRPDAGHCRYRLLLKN